MNPKKVLVVDDEPLIVKSALLLLKKAGTTAIGATSGQEGLELALSELPDLILLDLKMPKMSGWDVLARLKEDERLKGIPVALFSAEPIADSERIAVELKVIGILPKPLDSERINEILGKIEERPEAPPPHSSENTNSGPTEENMNRIVVERNLTGPFVTDVEQRLLEAIPTIGKSPVVLDLAGINVIDSRGIALCIGLKKECDKKGAPFTIEASPDIHKTFKILKLSRIIDMKEVDRS
jgi:anti-anti-sigma factor